ncbi:MAG: cation transporter [Dehalococcoidia bacterium]
MDTLSAPLLDVPADDCCAAKEVELAALSRRTVQRRVLVAVLLINLAMFAFELVAGVLARSSALIADSVDMFGDASVYALSLYALDRGLRWRAGAAVVKGSIILAFAIWLAIDIALKVATGTEPSAPAMGVVGAIALAANLVCLGLLWSFRAEDINMSSTWECSRNDVLANGGVLVAAAGVWLTSSGWPDLAVAAVIAVLFLRSAVRVLRSAVPQLKTGVAGVA